MEDEHQNLGRNIIPRPVAAIVVTLGATGKELHR
jgi:hypothetical protein